MVNQTNSRQEALLKEFAEHSLAAPFVFAPDNQTYKNQESADLVWACNNCIIPMWMTERKEYASESKRTRVRQRAIDHNLTQAKRWLKTWRNGGDIRGANDFHTFSLTFDAKCHVIILSVIKCGDAVAQFHDDEASKLGVRACVTLPQSAIEYLATGGGTTLDLLLILDYLRKRWGAGAIRENDVLDMIYSYGAAMCREVGIERLWPGGRIDDRFHQATYPLLAVRRRKGAENPDGPPVDWVGMSSLNDVFNDINIGELLYVSMAVRDGIDRTRNDPKFRDTLLHAHAKLNTYDFGLYFAFGALDVIRSEIETALGEWRDQIRAGTARYGPILLMDTESGNFQILLDKRIGPSQTEMLLDQWAAP